MNKTSATCIRSDCEQPRHVTSSGLIIGYCRKHEAERVRLLRRALVQDPETGDMLTAGALHQRRHRRLAATAEAVS